MRIISFTLLSIVYVALWLNLSLYFSVRFRQPATSALAGIAVWLFFTVFYPLIINLLIKVAAPSTYATERSVYLFERFCFLLTQLMPNELFSQATSTLLMPSVRSLGPLHYGANTGRYPRSLATGTELAAGVATAHRPHCTHADLFHFLLPCLHAAGDPIEVRKIAVC